MNHPSLLFANNSEKAAYGLFAKTSSFTRLMTFSENHAKSSKLLLFTDEGTQSQVK